MRYLIVLAVVLGCGTALAEDAKEAPKTEVVETKAEEVKTEEAKEAPAPKTEDAKEAPAPKTEEVKAPETVEEAAESLNILIEAAKGGHWSLFVGILLTLLVWLLDKFIGIRNRVGSKAMPWVAVGLGIMGTVGVGLTSGLGIAEVLVQGFITGSSAVGLWELVFQHALKKKEA